MKKKTPLTFAAIAAAVRKDRKNPKPDPKASAVSKLMGKTILALAGLDSAPDRTGRIIEALKKCGYWQMLIEREADKTAPRIPIPPRIDPEKISESIANWDINLQHVRRVGGVWVNRTKIEADLERSFRKQSLARQLQPLVVLSQAKGFTLGKIYVWLCTLGIKCSLQTVYDASSRSKRTEKKILNINTTKESLDLGQALYGEGETYGRYRVQDPRVPMGPKA